ncbi:MAG: hypothetical protein QM730_23665 [Anaerolineales bacterium]
MPKNNFWNSFINTGLVAWSIICLAIFMYFPGAISQMQGASLYDLSTLPEKLSKISIASYLFNTLIAFVGLAFFSIACISVGMKLASIFHLDERLKNDIHALQGILFSTYFLIGNAVFSLIFLTLASLSYLSRSLSIIILCLGIFSGIAQFRKLSIPAVHSKTNYEKVIAILSLAILVVSLFQSSSRISYDASAVYFSDAKLTALLNHVGFYLENTFLVSVFHSVIQFTAVMQVFGDQSARMIPWLFGVVNIVIVLELARLVGTSTLTRRILPILILTSTAFLDQMGDGKVELFSSAYSLAAIYWMTMNMNSQRSQQNLFLFFFAGSFLGFACILRPYNVFLLGIFILAYTTQQIKAGRFSLPQAVQYIAWISLGASGFAVYHLLMN